MFLREQTGSPRSTAPRIGRDVQGYVQGVAGGCRALGGVTLTGFLALAGCFLVACCGSPMLVVYLSLFGADFLPLAKSLVAVVNTLSIIGAWWWMKRRQSSPDPAPQHPPATKDAAAIDLCLAKLISRNLFGMAHAIGYPGQAP